MTCRLARDIIIVGGVCMLDVFQKITDTLVRNGKRVIGINGVDTSGKTTFTKNYSAFLKSVGIKNEIVSIDDFHNPSEIRSKGNNEIDAYYENAFNYRQIIDEIFETLRKTGSVEKDVLCLNLDTNKYKNVRHYRIDNETVVLVEGVLLFRPPLAEYLDGKVFLYVDFDEVLRRAAIRDVPKYGEEFLQKYEKKYIPIQKRYLSEYKPEENCDIWVDNNDFTAPVLQIRNIFDIIPPKGEET